MDERITARVSPVGVGGRVAQPFALFVAAALLVAAAGCATPKPAVDGETRAVSSSRCAPGSVIDDRHALCNGRSGRWW
ncbi:hypothetical protein K2X89_07355 [Myxococcota bacterium]|nr:hypothetical protein [Myxococcota bacterium]